MVVPRQELPFQLDGHVAGDNRLEAHVARAQLCSRTNEQGFLRTQASADDRLEAHVARAQLCGRG